jgi:hypothetical protein
MVFCSAQHQAVVFFSQINTSHKGDDMNFMSAFLKYKPTCNVSWGLLLGTLSRDFRCLFFYSLASPKPIIPAPSWNIKTKRSVINKYLISNKFQTNENSNRPANFT